MISSAAARLRMMMRAGWQGRPAAAAAAGCSWRDVAAQSRRMRLTRLFVPCYKDAISVSANRIACRLRIRPATVAEHRLPRGSLRRPDQPRAPCRRHFSLRPVARRRRRSSCPGGVPDGRFEAAGIETQVIDRGREREDGQSVGQVSSLAVVVGSLSSLRTGVLRHRNRSGCLDV